MKPNQSMFSDGIPGPSRALTVVAAMTLVALGATSCGDQNLDDYKRNREVEQAGQLKEASGKFGGMLVSDQNGSQLGWMTINLSVRSKVTPSTDGASKATDQPVLAGEIQLEGSGRDASLNIVDSQYDAYSHRFTANVTVASTCSSTSTSTASSSNSNSNSNSNSGSSSTPGGTPPPTSSGSNSCPPAPDTAPIEISGHIENGQITDGKIFAQNFPEQGASFTAQRNANPSAQVTAQMAAHAKDNQQKSVLQAYTGVTTFAKSHETHPVNLVILTTDLTPDQTFYDLLVPTRTVEVSLNYGMNLLIDYPTAIWDTRTQRISGSIQGQDQNEGERLTLTCQSVNNGSSGPITCEHRITGQGEAVATTTLQPAPLELKDPPVTAKDTNPYADDFVGDVHFPDGQTRQAILSIRHRRADRRYELWDLFFPYAQDSSLVSLYFANDTEYAIQNAALSLSEGTIYGSFQVQRGIINTIASSGSNQLQTTTANIDLDCTGPKDSSGSSGSTSRNTPAWDCQFFNSSLPTPPTAHFVLSHSPTYLLNKIGSQLAPQHQDFHGTTVIPAGNSPLEKRSNETVSMTVVYPARTRQEDISLLFFPSLQLPVQATVSLSDKDTEGLDWGLFSYPDSFYDSVNGTLDGNQTNSATSNGTPANFISQLHCEHFYFMSTRGTVTCKYTSYRNGVEWKITLRPWWPPGEAPKPQATTSTPVGSRPAPTRRAPALRTDE